MKLPSKIRNNARYSSYNYNNNKANAGSLSFGSLYERTYYCYRHKILISSTMLMGSSICLLLWHLKDDDHDATNNKKDKVSDDDYDISFGEWYSTWTSTALKEFWTTNQMSYYGSTSSSSITSCSSTGDVKPPMSRYTHVLPYQMIYPNDNIEICYDKRTRTAIYAQHRIILSLSSSQHQEQQIATGSSCGDSSSIETLQGEDDDVDNDDDDDSSSSTGSTTSSRRRSNDNDKQTNNGRRRKRYHFKEDSTIPIQYRSRNSYYHLSGYDRGHLAPAGDFTRHAFPATNAMLDDHDYVSDTYQLCNISPQNHDMNRKIWSYFESKIRQWIRRQQQQLITQQQNKNDAITTKKLIAYITTGPLWLPQKEQIANKLYEYQYNGIGMPPYIIQVPTHFFKVILIGTMSSDDDDMITICRFGCFVIPNTSSANEYTIADYIVPWTKLETVTGLTFYPQYIDDTFKSYADHITEEMMMIHQEQQRYRRRNNNQNMKQQQISSSTHIENPNALMLSSKNHMDDTSSISKNHKNDNKRKFSSKMISYIWSHDNSVNQTKQRYRLDHNIQHVMADEICKQ